MYCKPETVFFYNQTKVGMDVLDQMSRLYSMKAARRKWPVHIFYDVIDMALINSWVIYTKLCARAALAIARTLKKYVKSSLVTSWCYRVDAF